MKRQQYCVYNQTSESFLSLGVTETDSSMSRLRELLAGRPFKSGDGQWISLELAVPAFGWLTSRDLIYLDESLRVVHMVESFPALRMARRRANARSMLALPIHTIYSSQTQVGNQLVICGAEEMDFQLGRGREADQDTAVADLEPTVQESARQEEWLAAKAKVDTGAATRGKQPHKALVEIGAPALQVEGVRRFGRAGMFLLTEERLPVGALVRMTLRTEGGCDENPEPEIIAQLRVQGWGPDGIELALAQPSPSEPVLMEAAGR